MTMTYAAITGRITIPGTELGIRAKVTATPMSTDHVLAFDDRTTWGPRSVETDNAGNLPTGTSALRVPLGSTLGEAVLWKITAEAIDKIQGLDKWNVTTTTITADTTIQALAHPDVTVVTPTLATTVGENAAAAQTSADNAAASATSASGWADAAASSAADAATDADLAAASATDAANNANGFTGGTATTLAAGAAPTVSISGTAPNRQINLGIPGAVADDAAVTALDANPSSSFRTQQDARLTATYVPRWKASTAYVTGDKVMNPDGLIVERTSDGTSGTTYTGANWKVATGPANAFVGKDTLFVNVKDHGAKGDGVADDTSAFNSAVAAAAGGTVLVPAGTYLIDADYAGGKSIRLNVAGTRLSIAPAATLQAKTNALDNYTIVAVDAADCVIEGGAIRGEKDTHTGSTGEYGYGIAVHAAGHRARIVGVRVSNCWGDGIIIGNDGSLSGLRPDDVSVIDCTVTGNRRNNMSLISANRPRVTGGIYSGAGGTSPHSGICIEPNATPADQDVTDAVFVGVVTQGNAGRGFQIHGHDNSISARLIGCMALGNAGDAGFGVDGAAEIHFSSCTATGNGTGTTGDGFIVAATATAPVTISACVSRSNGRFGYTLQAKTSATASRAMDNGSAGFYFSGTGCNGVALTAVGNNTSSGFYGQITVDAATDTRLTACVSDVGNNATKPTRGYRLTSGTTGAVLTGCTTRGTFSSGAFSDLGTGTIAWPVPGTAKPTAFTQTYSTASKTHSNPTAAAVATTASTSTTPFGYTTAAQADAIVTAINALVTDVANVKQVLNSVIDDLQAQGQLS